MSIVYTLSSLVSISSTDTDHVRTVCALCICARTHGLAISCWWNKPFLVEYPCFLTFLSNPENLKGIINWFQWKITYHPLLSSWNSARTRLFYHQLINCIHTVDNRTCDKESIISVLKETVSQLLSRSIWRRSIQSEGSAGAATAAAAGGPAAPAPLRQVTWQVPPLQHPF